MDISSLGSSTTPVKSTSTTGTALANFGQAKSMTDSMLVSLLPSASMPGIGGNLDIYAAVGKQSQGLLAGGRTALEIANISLGIDMKQTSTDVVPTPSSTDPAAADTAQTGASDASAGSATTATHTHDILNDLLKADGYVAPAPDPYVVQKDFFADQGATGNGAASSGTSSTTQYYTNPDLSNPNLGGLLNSLG